MLSSRELSVVEKGEDVNELIQEFRLNARLVTYVLNTLLLSLLLRFFELTSENNHSFYFIPLNSDSGSI